MNALTPYTEGLLSRKLRQQLRHLVYAEITRWDEYETAPAAGSG